MKNNSETSVSHKSFSTAFFKKRAEFEAEPQGFTLQEHFWRFGTLAGRPAAKRSFAASLFAVEKGSQKN